MCHAHSAPLTDLLTCFFSVDRTKLSASGHSAMCPRSHPYVVRYQRFNYGVTKDELDFHDGAACCLYPTTQVAGKGYGCGNFTAKSGSLATRKTAADATKIELNPAAFAPLLALCAGFEGRKPCSSYRATTAFHAHPFACDARHRSGAAEFSFSGPTCPLNRLSAPAKISACAPLLLSAAGSAGVAGGGSALAWSSNLTEASVVAALKKATAANAKQVKVTQSGGAATAAFSLRVTDSATGIYKSQTQLVQFTSGGTDAAISMTGGAVRSVRCSQPLSLTPKIATGTCGGEQLYTAVVAGGPKVFNLSGSVYSWKLASSTSSKVSITSAASLQQRVLRLPSRSLLSGATLFEFSWRHPPSGMTGATKVEVACQPEPITLRVKGGSARTLGAADTCRLEALALDPLQLGGISYSWTCVAETAKGGSPSCGAHKSATGASWAFAATRLAAGSYTFSVSANQASTMKTGFAAVSVTKIATDPPSVSIVETAAAKVAATSPLLLRGSVTTRSAKDQDELNQFGEVVKKNTVTLSWSATSAADGKGLDLRGKTSTPTSASCDTRGQDADATCLLNLVLRPNALAAGSSYVFRLSASTQTGASGGSASVGVLTTYAPTAGSFSVTPATGGTALATLFKLEVTGWRDSDMPLRYLFSSVSKRPLKLPLKFPLTQFQHETTATARLSSSTTALEVTAQDVYGASTSKTTPVSVGKLAISGALEHSVATLLAAESESALRSQIIYAAAGAASSGGSTGLATAASKSLRSALLRAVSDDLTGLDGAKSERLSAALQLVVSDPSAFEMETDMPKLGDSVGKLSDAASAAIAAATTTWPQAFRNLMGVSSVALRSVQAHTPAAACFCSRRRLAAGPSAATSAATNASRALAISQTAAAKAIVDRLAQKVAASQQLGEDGRTLAAPDGGYTLSVKRDTMVGLGGASLGGIFASHSHHITSHVKMPSGAQLNLLKPAGLSPKSDGLRTTLVTYALDANPYFWASKAPLNPSEPGVPPQAEMAEVFNNIDTSRDGYISVYELQRGLVRMGWKGTSAYNLAADDDTLGLEETTALANSLDVQVGKQEIAAAAVGYKKDGKLSLNELIRWIRVEPKFRNMISALGMPRMASSVVSFAVKDATGKALFDATRPIGADATGFVVTIPTAAGEDAADAAPGAPSVAPAARTDVSPADPRGSNIECATWDDAAAGGVAGWRIEGKLLARTPKHVQCESKHLSSFAAMLGPAAQFTVTMADIVTFNFFGDRCDN